MIIKMPKRARLSTLVNAADRLGYALNAATVLDREQEEFARWTLKAKPHNRWGRKVIRSFTLAELAEELNQLDVVYTFLVIREAEDGQPMGA